MHLIISFRYLTTGFVRSKLGVYFSINYVATIADRIHRTFLLSSRTCHVCSLQHFVEIDSDSLGLQKFLEVHYIGKPDIESGPD